MVLDSLPAEAKFPGMTQVVKGIAQDMGISVVGGIEPISPSGIELATDLLKEAGRLKPADVSRRSPAVRARAWKRHAAGPIA